MQNILKPGFEKPLNSIAEVRFRDFAGLAPGADLLKAGYTFHKNQFQLNDNFSIGARGLTFQFNPYEVSCYACRAPVVFLPYSDIRNLIRPDAHIP